MKQDLKNSLLYKEWQKKQKNRKKKDFRHLGVIGLMSISLFSLIGISEASTNNENIEKAKTKVVIEATAPTTENTLLIETLKDKEPEVATVKEEIVVPKVEVKEEVKPVEPVEQPKVVVEQKKEEVTPVPVATPTPAPVKTSEPKGFVYNSQVPMPQEHQAYLYKLSQERGLDFKKTLATVQHESSFDADVISSTNDYGYFQINRVNHAHLSNTLNVSNNALDPFININMGTYMLGDLYDHFKEKGLQGEALDIAVWGSYNRGLGGYQKYGAPTQYVEGMKEAIQEVNAYFQ